MKNLKEFKQICKYWSRVFAITPLKIYLKHIKEPGFIAYYSNLRHCLTISHKFLKTKNSEFYCYLFHELGHAHFRHRYNTIKQKIKSEKQAEEFSLYQLKRYFPKYYKQIIPKRKNMLKELKEIYKKYPHLRPHYYAFKQIKEYK